MNRETTWIPGGTITISNPLEPATSGVRVEEDLTLESESEWSSEEDDVDGVDGAASRQRMPASRIHLGTGMPRRSNPASWGSFSSATISLGPSNPRRTTHSRSSSSQGSSSSGSPNRLPSYYPRPHQLPTTLDSSPETSDGEAELTLPLLPSSASSRASRQRNWPVRTQSPAQLHVPAPSTSLSAATAGSPTAPPSLSTFILNALNPSRQSTAQDDPASSSSFSSSLSSTTNIPRHAPASAGIGPQVAQALFFASQGLHDLASSLFEDIGERFAPRKAEMLLRAGLTMLSRLSSCNKGGELDWSSEPVAKAMLCLERYTSDLTAIQAEDQAMLVASLLDAVRTNNVSAFVAAVSEYSENTDLDSAAPAADRSRSIPLDSWCVSMMLKIKVALHARSDARVMFSDAPVGR